MRGLHGTGSWAWYPLAVVLLLPVLMLAANAQWIFDSTHFFDTNVYLGFFRHYLEFKAPYAANYKSSRLPFVLPGVVAYRVLPAVAAHHVLFLVPHAIKTALLYAIIRRRWGGGLALVVSSADAVFTIPHPLSSYHDQMASTYLTAAIASVLLPTERRLELRAAFAGFFLATALTTDVLVIGVAPVVGLHLLAAERRPFRVARVALIAATAVGGALSALILFGAINRLLGGPFLFFVDQLTMSAHLAKVQALSVVKLSEFIAKIWNFPWLVLPLAVGASSLVLLARVIVRRVQEGRWAAEDVRPALDALGLVGSLAAAVWMQLRGLGVLEHPHLFHPFYVPVFLAVPALVAGARMRADVRLGWLDIAAVALLAAGPLVLLGAPLSRMLERAGAAWPPAIHGVPFAAAGLLIAVLVRVLGRRHPRVIILAGAFGLTAANAFCVTPWQPTYVYQLGDRCTFRSDAFSVITDADAVLAAFDPDSEARWASSGGPEYPAFDGEGWCKALPLQTVARAALLTRYFYTSDEFIHGVQVKPLKKVILAGTSGAELEELEASAKTGLPPGGRMERVLDKQIVRGTVSLQLWGYDVVLAK